MNRFFATAAVLAAAILGLSSCTSTKVQEKPKYLWIAVDANYERMSNQDSIRWYLDKAKETGFNQVVVDVRGVEGDVLTMRNGWDFLKFTIDEAHARGMKVSVSETIFPLGCPMTGTGAVYRDPSLKALTCLEYTPNGMIKIEDDPSQVAAFMNPLLPEAQERAMANIREIFENYDFEGFSLDYCRFPGAQSDFSEYTRKAFEAEIGETVGNWPEDIFSYAEDGSMVPGKYYRQWWKFRAMVIRNFVARVKEYKDNTKPEVKLEYWAASWLHGLYKNGQNWAAPTARYYNQYLGDWADKDYWEAGFADQLDIFISGTYLERTRGIDDPESIEFGLARSRRDIDGACTMMGSFYLATPLDFEDVAYVCLTQSDGLMAFDMCYLADKPQLWDDIKRGIDRAEKELGIRK